LPRYVIGLSAQAGDGQGGNERQLGTELAAPAALAPGGGVRGGSDDAVPQFSARRGVRSRP
jgi:hypothetical protein